MAATNRMIGVTRKCFKDSGLLDVLGLPVEASSFALTSVLRLESAHSPSTCAESPRPRLGASLLLGWCLGWVGIGGAQEPGGKMRPTPQHCWGFSWGQRMCGDATEWLPDHTPGPRRKQHSGLTGSH